jgi:protein-S-isoprenylcysteine O-methyltransferase Ste14
MKWFRVAPAASTARHVATTLIQIVLFWSTFLVVLPAAIQCGSVPAGLAPMPFPGHRAIGCTLFLVASALGLTTGMLMAVRGRGTPLPLQTARELVIAGPYRFVRNPMALAGITQGIAVGLYLADFVVVAYAVAGAVAWHTIARPPEELDLLQRFGEPYRRYREAVPLWLPRRRPYASAPPP